MIDAPKILLVEDHPLHRELVFDELQDLNFDVQKAETPSEALKILEVFRPHLFLFDIVIQGNKISMIDMVRSLQTRPEFKRVPVIFVTAYQKEISNLIEGIPNSEVLAKPFPFEVLVQKMRDALRQAGQGYYDG